MAQLPDGATDNQCVDRSRHDPSKRLTRLFLAAAVLVAAISFTWSELSNDPDCSEGPCRQDGPLILGAAVGREYRFAGPLRAAKRPAPVC